MQARRGRRGPAAPPPPGPPPVLRAGHGGQRQRQPEGEPSADPGGSQLPAAAGQGGGAPAAGAAREPAPPPPLPGQAAAWQEEGEAPCPQQQGVQRGPRPQLAQQQQQQQRWGQQLPAWQDAVPPPQQGARLPMAPARPAPQLPATAAPARAATVHRRGAPGAAAAAIGGGGAAGAAAVASGRFGDFSERGAAAALAAAAAAGPAAPAKFGGLAGDRSRPWQAEVIHHLCCELPPPACHIYCDMTVQAMQRVLSRRAVAERRLRDHREAARFQLARANGWQDKARARAPARTFAYCVLAGGAVSPNELRAAAAAALKLRTEAGTTAAQLRALAGAARAYSDADYEAHAAALQACLDEIVGFTEALRRRLLPFAAAAQGANLSALAARAAGPIGAAGAAAADAARRAALDALGPPPEVGLPPAPRAPWRYPPRPYVLHKRKGLRGGWAAPLAMPGLDRRPPAVRRGRDMLPAPPGGGPGGGQQQEQQRQLGAGQGEGGGGARGALPAAAGEAAAGGGALQLPGGHIEAPAPLDDSFAGMFD
ncbi:MAG: hypothetical protein J3K34DRAFT_523407 [Monoraphidium minutum]|nr:MAG: hypothetical protein J3K34DRAFT_523407 [Monoraphidium minutum]